MTIIKRESFIFNKPEEVELAKEFKEAVGSEYEYEEYEENIIIYKETIETHNISNIRVEKNDDNI